MYPAALGTRLSLQFKLALIQYVHSSNTESTSHLHLVLPINKKVICLPSVLSRVSAHGHLEFTGQKNGDGRLQVHQERIRG